MKNSDAVEKLLHSAKFDNVRANTIARLIVNIITKVGLDPLMCRSPPCNEAGNMSRKQKGASNQF